MTPDDRIAELEAVVALLHALQVAFTGRPRIPAGG
jgi:hypothetical protein